MEVVQAEKNFTLIKVTAVLLSVTGSDKYLADITPELRDRFKTTVWGDKEYVEVLPTLDIENVNPNHRIYQQLRNATLSFDELLIRQNAVEIHVEFANDLSRYAPRFDPNEPHRWMAKVLSS